MKNQLLKTLTDELYRETQIHGYPDFKFNYYLENVYEFDFHCIAWHWHNEFEMIYARQGSVMCYIGTDKIELPQGYGLFVNSGVLHRYEALENNLLPNIVFSPELLGEKQGRIFIKYVQPIIESGVDFQVFQPNVVWQNTILQYLNNIFELQKNVDFSELEIIIQIYKLWNILFDNVKAKTKDSHNNSEILHRSQLQIMMQFIHANFATNITLKDIASAVYISKNSALQIFQKGIHISPISYLIQYRLSRAAELLITTEKNISNIAIETGFENVGYFCRMFKKQYGISPTEYRKITNQ